MDQTPNNLAAYCWSIADLLRGDFKQSQYGRIILPFTLLRRLECVLQASKAGVLAEYERVQEMGLPEEAQEKLLLRAAGDLSFFNTSKMDLSKLGESDIKDNLESYIQSFSKDAREIFEHFNFREFIGQLNDADLLYKVVKKVRATDLSPTAISNHDMGLTFEELIRRVVLLLRYGTRRDVRRWTFTRFHIIDQLELELRGRAAAGACFGEIHLTELTLLHEHRLYVSFTLFE